MFRTGPALTPLETWAASQGLSGADAEPLATAHGDGISNLLKFALGLPGNAPAAPAALPSATVSGTNLAFEFHRATDQVRDIVESSTTLAPDSWTPGANLERMPVPLRPARMSLWKFRWKPPQKNISDCVSNSELGIPD